MTEKQTPGRLSDFIYYSFLQCSESPLEEEILSLKIDSVTDLTNSTNTLGHFTTRNLKLQNLAFESRVIAH